MSDPIPEGYISLTEAWSAYVRAGSENTEPGQLVEPFANAELQAFVRFPGSDQNYRLLPSSWRDQFFSERAFLADTIIPTKDNPWSQFSGRTPFISESEFQNWLTEHFGGERETPVSPSHHVDEKGDASAEEGSNNKKGSLSHSQLWEQATSWLSAKVGAWRTGDGERLSRVDVEHALKKQFGIRSPTAREVWKAGAPSEWRIPGRHRKDG